ncbi:DNA repair protein RecO [Corallococcus macrosporus]|uniref:DNA repair protein RecO n=1 Tax=Myxococcus fulvus (strain ATCC BAA-855 / HW-1) TaxID=483219 RepID=F8CLK2_MYXFH|nr:DNA repair protein RecO [Corallococcus macrosporus]AEI66526.1 DNA repair protein RecO [Corallococcus macrosporus]
MERYDDDALVLSSVDYGESDRLVTLLTREHGKLTAFAAGARKSKRRFAGALEPFMRLRVHLVETRGSTVRLDGADIVAGFYAAREDLSLIARALYAVELCRELTREHEPHPELFALLEAYLARLDAKEAGPTSLLAFELSALAHAGLMPRFDSCSLCGGAPGERPRFDQAHGGAVCEPCGFRARESVAVPVALLTGLRALQDGQRTPLPPDLRARARGLLNVFIAHHLGRRLKSVDFMAQVGLD